MTSWSSVQLQGYLYDFKRLTGMKSPTGFNTGVKIEKSYFIYFLKSIICKDFFLHLIQIVN